MKPTQMTPTPQSLYPVSDSLNEVINSGIGQLPIADPNQLRSLLMQYHNTLLSEVGKAWFAAKPQEAEPVGVVPQDVEEFIATRYRIFFSTGAEKFISETDLRAWMAGHVRVPVEPTEEMLEAGCKQHDRQQDPRYNNNELSEYECKAIYKAMLNASKEEP